MRATNVRRWLNKAHKHAKKNMRLHDAESIADGTSIMLIDSIMRDKLDNVPNSDDFMGLNKSREKYRGDSSSFEFGCYAYFSLDLWHHTQERDPIILRDRWVPSFIDVFESCMGVPLNDVFYNRMATYTNIVNNEKEEPLKALHFRLEQLLLRTVNDTPPKKYNWESFPVALGNFSDDMFLKIEIAGFYKGMLPAMISLVTKVYEFIQPSR